MTTRKGLIALPLPRTAMGHPVSKPISRSNSTVNRVGPEFLRAVLGAAASLCRTPDFRVLVTTRPLPRDELEPLLREEVPVFRIQPFGLNGLREFANQWFPSLRLPEAEALADRFLQRATT